MFHVEQFGSVTYPPHLGLMVIAIERLCMRELALLDTLGICLLLLLSLVLPLMLSFRPPQDAQHKKACLKVVWMGQIWGALAGISIYASATVTPYAMVLGTLGCLICARMLSKKLRSGEING